MQFPYKIRLQRGRRTRASSLGACAGLVLATALAGNVAYTLSSRQAPATADRNTASIQVTSEPPGASIEVDGQSRGHTPASIAVEAGEHELTLNLPDHAVTTRMISAAGGRTIHVSVPLWLHTATVSALRPPLPGSAIKDARFLRDGRIALAVLLPNNGGAQAWLIKTDGSFTQIGPDSLPTTTLALGPDGSNIAYLASVSRDENLGVDSGYREVWLIQGRGRDRKLYVLPTDSNEPLVDVAWAPDGSHLLLVSNRRSFDGGGTSRLLWMPVSGGVPRELASLPAEVVRGSYSWSPADEGVAFLARSNDTVSLCAVRTDGSIFRYLADVSREVNSLVPYAPLSWSQDGRRVIYSAPAELKADADQSPHVLYTDDLSGRPSIRLGTVDGQSPAWRDSGEIIALLRTGASKPLVLRTVDSGGTARDAGVVPLEADAFAVRWDVAHAQALVAIPDPSGFSSHQTLWLARWTKGTGR